MCVRACMQTCQCECLQTHTKTTTRTNTRKCFHAFISAMTDKNDETYAYTLCMCAHCVDSSLNVETHTWCVFSLLTCCVHTAHNPYTHSAHSLPYTHSVYYTHPLLTRIHLHRNSERSDREIHTHAHPRENCDHLGGPDRMVRPISAAEALRPLPPPRISAATSKSDLLPRDSLTNSCSRRESSARESEDKGGGEC